MEVIGGNTVGLDRFGSALGRIESHLDPAYDVMKISRVALGDAPINFASTALSGTIKMAVGSSDAKTNQAIGHAGLAADGLFRGLLYSGGILHGVAARKLPWLVLDRTPPSGFGRVASSLDSISKGARLGLLGIGGTLGAIRAAKAVVASGGDARALYMTRDGRGGTLQALGSALLMVKHPATYLAGAGVYTAALVNDLL